MKAKASNRLGNLTKSPIFQIVAAQFFATFLASVLCLVFDRVAAISAVMAGVTCVLPGCYTLMVSMRPVIKGDPGLSQALRGEVGKIVLTAALFALVFVFVKPLNVWVFFGTFVGLQLCVAGVLLLQSRKLMKR